MSDLREELQRALGESYTIERELGGGGMSTTFVACDNSLGRSVVVKVLPFELAASVSVERFKREIMLSAALQHPHIVPVLAAGQTESLPYFIMPYVDGESLRARMARGPLSVRETVSILKDVARALAYAHSRGVIHRDIKPDNILLSGGAAMVTDFGVAKAISASRERVTLGGRGPNSGGFQAGTITTVGMSLGTPAYMAPEQAAADPNTDHRADLYALGIVGYEMLVGAPPFHGRTPQALLAAQLTEAPPPLGTRRYDVPPALAELLMRCLEKEPGKRPRTANEVARALDDPAMMSGEFSASTERPRTRTGAPARSPWRRRASLLGIVVVLLGAGLAGGTYFRAREASTAAAPALAGAAGAAGAAADPGAKSLVVMPFVNIGGDSSDVYFAEGMTSELTNALAKLPTLRVAPRSAAAAARTRYVSTTEIGQALGVHLLLEGTVQRSRNQLRVTARLINVDDGSTLWSDMYQRNLTDVFTVQDELTSSIVDALRTELTASAGGAAAAVASVPPASAVRGTDDLQAYDLYLRGRHFFVMRGAQPLRRALGYFREATRRDSSFARAYAGIADVEALLPLYTDESLDSAVAVGLRMADRAITLDGSLAEAYTSRANLLSLSWRWSDAERDYRRALAIDSNYATAHQWYGELLLLNGRLDDAIEQLAEATRLDPLSPVAFGSYAVALGIARRDGDASAAAARAIELDSTSLVTRMMSGSVHLYAGRLARAITDLEAAYRIDSTSAFTIGVLGYAYARSGNAARARQLADRMERAGGRSNSAAAAAARIELGLGDTARALTLLERAASAHDVSFSTEVLAEPFFDPVRRTPRFAAVVSRVGLDPRVLQPR